MTRTQFEETASRLGLKLCWGAEIMAGDQYLAGIKSGPHLLTARYINETRGWIGATTPAYSYDIRDCVKVIKNVL